MLVALIGWWYAAGWINVLQQTKQQVNSVTNFFSVGLLLRTWFDPFRQIAAAQTQGNINAMFHAWTDRLFSRCVGFVVRTIFIILGSLLALLSLLAGLVQLLIWPCIPALPVLAIIGFAAGWR